MLNDGGFLRQISTIGLPTNVTHHGHATSVEDAEKLISRLLGAPSTDDNLPPPLVPGGKAKRKWMAV